MNLHPVETQYLFLPVLIIIIISYIIIKKEIQAFKI